jgi:hypothetical protein
VSANPQVVLADVWVTWGVPGTPPLYVKRGTWLDCLPGSAMENAYGGPVQPAPAVHGGGRGRMRHPEQGGAGELSMRHLLLVVDSKAAAIRFPRIVPRGGARDDRAGRRDSSRGRRPR